MKIDIFPLSERAITLYFDQVISFEVNDQVLRACSWLAENPFHGMQEVVPAYASFTVFYDIMKVNKFYAPTGSVYSHVKAYLEAIPFEKLVSKERKSPLVEIPVHYLGKDLNYVAEYLQLSISEIIKIHTKPVYTVYMMGFLPGFPYLGGLDSRLHVPRKENPAINVTAGSVGIAGNQTGIYPLDSPGGWQIIGHTDRKLFRPNEASPTLLKSGDRVKFVDQKKIKY